MTPSIFALILSTALLAGSAMAASPIDELVSGAAARQASAITVYNDDLALVKERRKVLLKPGLTRLSLREVSARRAPKRLCCEPCRGARLRCSNRTSTSTC